MASPPLEREGHESRVQSNRQQKMTPAKRSHGQDSRERSDAVPVRDKIITHRQHDHGSDSENRKRERILEVLQDARDFDPEIGELGFLACGTPRHVDLEHVGQEGLRNVEGEAAEEDG